MSKVKIQGHASGTGVLTVTAPNTSTDRTITLPDSTGELLSTAGGTMTGDLILGDDVSLEIGSGNNGDLQLYHSGGHNTIDSKTGDLVIRTDALRMYNQANNEALIKGDADGEVQLFHNGVEKFNTTATGVAVTGGVAIGGTGAANTLDDYEEGTWTPALSGVTGSFSTSGTHNYTKVGRIVTLNGYIYNCSSISNTSANWLFSGLPFAPIQDCQGAVSTYNVTLTSSNSYVTIRAAANNSSLALVESRNGTVGVLIPFSAVGTGHLDFTITYATNA
jgi:hypothetical protein